MGVRLQANDKDILFCAKLFDRLDVSGSGCLGERELSLQIAEAKVNLLLTLKADC